MNALQQTFAQLRERNELGFMPYQTAGFPSLAESLQNLKLLEQHGADILELGVPFSDPIADGPTIQHSSQAALAAGVRLPDVLTALEDVSLSCPLVLMSYLNPLMAYGTERLFADMQAAGCSGLIVPDLPLEEAPPWLAAARRHDISIIFLLAPTSTDERIRQAAALSDSFIYAVSLTGTTGARSELYSGLPAFLSRIRAVTDRPIVVGFGISRPEHVRSLHAHADGIVVASRIIDAIRRGDDWLPLVESLKAATRR